MSAGTLERADEILDDLLDEFHDELGDKVHAHCLTCWPRPGRVVALCGRPKITGPRVPPAQRHEIPPNACPECVELFDKPCRRCGS